MISKNVLIIGDPDSIWLKRYIENILLSSNFKITIAGHNYEAKFSEFYENNGIRVLCYKGTNTIIKRIPKAQGLMKLLYFLLNRKQYDVIHMHYVMKGSIRLMRVAASYRKKATKICTFWGSDLLRTENDALLALDESLHGFNHITLSTTEMQNKFRSVFGKSHDDKISLPLFGITGFDDISNVLKTQTRESCKKHFGVENRIVICVGHNGSEKQQHIKVIEQMHRLPSAVANKIIWFFPMGYGFRTDEYTENLHRELKNINAEYKIFDYFMEDIDVAKLRVATDIFIHAQTTDAFSASLQEFIYAGAKVVNPSWIKYSKLTDNQIKYCEYNSFDDLPAIVVESVQRGIHNNDDYNDDYREKLENLTSWRAVKESWLRLYA